MIVDPFMNALGRACPAMTQLDIILPLEMVNTLSRYLHNLAELRIANTETFGGIEQLHFPPQLVKLQLPEVFPSLDLLEQLAVRMPALVELELGGLDFQDTDLRVINMDACAWRKLTLRELPEEYTFEYLSKLPDGLELRCSGVSDSERSIQMYSYEADNVPVQRLLDFGRKIRSTDAGCQFTLQLNMGTALSPAQCEALKPLDGRINALRISPQDRVATGAEILAAAAALPSAEAVTYIGSNWAADWSADPLAGLNSSAETEVMDALSRLQTATAMKLDVPVSREAAVMLATTVGQQFVSLTFARAASQWGAAAVSGFRQSITDFRALRGLPVLELVFE